MSKLSPILVLEEKIHRIRGHNVMLDSDLAQLYGVTVKRLNEQMRRNIKRFPPDFAFQLSPEEAASLRTQYATLNVGRGTHRKYLPYAFTEQGVAMLSGVLTSDRAIEANIQIMRAFVQLRHWMLTHKEFAERLNKLERQLLQQGSNIRNIFEAIRQMMQTPNREKPVIGFKP